MPPFSPAATTWSRYHTSAHPARTGAARSHNGRAPLAGAAYDSAARACKGRSLAPRRRLLFLHGRQTGPPGAVSPAYNRAPKRCMPPPRYGSAGGLGAGDDTTRRRLNPVWVIRIFAERTLFQCPGLRYGMVRHHKMIKNGRLCSGVAAVTCPVCAPLWRRRILASACRSLS